MGRPCRGEETENKQRCGWRRCYWSLQRAKARQELPSSRTFSRPSLPGPVCFMEGPGRWNRADFLGILTAASSY